MRSPRLKPEKDRTLHHCMNRTVQQLFYFEKETVREWIYKRITWLASIYYVDLYSIVVMSNHYHIVCAIRRPELDEADIERRFERYEIKHPSRHRAWYPWLVNRWHRRLSNISDFMRDVNQSIAAYVKASQGLKWGHLWGDRFNNTLIEDGPGLLACMAYVELNPVRAGMVRKPSEYRYCSTGRFFQGGREQAGVTIPPLYGLDSIPAGKRQRAFMRLVNHMALEKSGEAGRLPVELADLEKKLTDFDFTEFLELVLYRTRWITHSAIVGSRQFCEKLITDNRLQPLSSRPKTAELTAWLHTSHQRAGPYLR